MFAVEPATADGAFAADNKHRHWLDKAVVGVDGFSDVACEPACGGVLFLALSDWAEKVPARRILWFKVFGVSASSVLPFNLCAKGLVSEQGAIKVFDGEAEVAASLKPLDDSKISRAQAFEKRFQTTYVCE